MKKKIWFIILSLTAAVLSFQIRSLEFLLLGLILLCLLSLAITGIFNIFKRPNRNVYKFLIMPIGICLIGVFASLFRPYEEAVLDSGSVGEKLQHAYETDQGDRKQLKSFVKYFTKLEERDKSRLTQVNNILEQGKTLEPIEKFYAAFIYHHSDNSKDYEKASKLAAAAAEKEDLQKNLQVQWLKRASYDRWMLSLGKPEKYNTQDKFSLEVE